MKSCLRLFPKLALLLVFSQFFPIPSASAQEKNGYRISVQKTTLARDDYRGGGYYADKIDRTLALKVNIRNIGMKVKPEATIEFVILVKRWGYAPPRIEKFSGTEKLASLKQQEFADFTLGKVRIGGYANYGNKRYQDDVEAWKVLIKEEGIEAASFQSGSSFDRLFEKAVSSQE